MHHTFRRQYLQKSRKGTMIKSVSTREVQPMAEGHDCNEGGLGRNLYPALTIALIAGIALTTYVFVRKARTPEDSLPVEKVVNLCNSAADKLDAFLHEALAS